MSDAAAKKRGRSKLALIVAGAAAGLGALGALIWLVTRSDPAAPEGPARTMFVLDVPNSAVWDMARHGNMVFVSSRDGAVTVRRLDQPRAPPRFIRAPLRAQDPAQHYPIALSPDGRTLAFGTPRELNGPQDIKCNSARIYFYSADGGGWRLSGMIDGVVTNMRTLEFSPDAGLIAAGLNDGQGAVVFRTAPAIGRGDAFAVAAAADVTVWRDDAAEDACNLEAPAAARRPAVYETAFQRRGAQQVLAFIMGPEQGRMQTWLTVVPFDGVRARRPFRTELTDQNQSAGDALTGVANWTMAMSHDGRRLAVAGLTRGRECAANSEAAAPALFVYDLDDLVRQAGEPALVLPLADGQVSAVLTRRARIGAIAWESDGGLVVGGDLYACRGARPALAHPEVYSDSSPEDSTDQALATSHGVVVRWPASGDGFGEPIYRRIGYSTLRRVISLAPGRALGLRSDGDVFELDLGADLPNHARLPSGRPNFVATIAPQRMPGEPCGAGPRQRGRDPCAMRWDGLMVADDGVSVSWRAGQAADGALTSIGIRPTLMRVDAEDGGARAPPNFRSVIRACPDAIECARAAAWDPVAVTAARAADIDALFADLRLIRRIFDFTDYNNRDDFRSLAISPDGARYYLSTARRLRAFGRTGEQLWCQAVPADAFRATADAERVVTASSDGVIRWYRAADGLPIAAAFVDVGARRAVAWLLEDSVYAATANGGASLGVWLRGNDRQQPRAGSFARAAGANRPGTVYEAIANPQSVAPLREQSGDCVAGENPAPPQEMLPSDVAIDLSVNSRGPDAAGVYDIDSRDLALRFRLDAATNDPSANVQLRFAGADAPAMTRALRGRSGELAVQVPFASLQRGRVYQLQYTDVDDPLASTQTLTFRWAGADEGEPPRRRVIALLIGVREATLSARRDFEHLPADARQRIDNALVGLDTLEGPRLDLARWRDYLNNVQGATEVCVAMLSDHPPSRLSEGDACAAMPNAQCFGEGVRVHAPSRAVMDRCLRELREADGLTGDDVVIVAFHGHGATTSANLTTAPQHILVLGDDTMFAADLAAAIGQLPAAKLIMLDACRTNLERGLGTISYGAIEQEMQARLEGIYLIGFGSSDGHPSLETPEGGWFTRATLMAMRNELPFVHGQTQRTMRWRAQGGVFDLARLADVVSTSHPCSAMSLLNWQRTSAAALSQQPVFVPRNLPTGVMTIETSGQRELPPVYVPVNRCRQVGG